MKLACIAALFAGLALRQDPPKVEVAVYYFPNYHLDARNEKQHGKGWSEWELVKKAKPRFEGHRQPKVPLWGYTDEANPIDMAQKIDAAADHGVSAFIFDWYWYNDGPFLQRALDEGFLKAKNVGRLKFSLMWANHDWEDIHPATLGVKPKLLYPGVVSDETWETLTDFIIKNYFSHPSYWKIDGRPYFSLYSVGTFTRGENGMKRGREALDRFREKTKKAGFPDLHLNVIDEGTLKPKQVTELGGDSVTAYHLISLLPMKTYPATDYAEMTRTLTGAWNRRRKQFEVPYYPHVSMGWDVTPRCNPEAGHENKGYPFMPTAVGNTPVEFKKLLRQMKEALADAPAKDRILTVNSWNEWTEGSYLEPDTVDKMGFLEALKDVMSRP